MATDIAQFFCIIEKNKGLYDDKVALQKICLACKNASHILMKALFHKRKMIQEYSG